MADFSMSRSTTINAPTDRVHGLVDDFRQWPQWSPWEGLDPAMERTYSGPASGVGSRYHWSGNKKAGEGEMEIIESIPARVAVDLTFLKPFKARNLTTFDLEQAGNGHTRVVWTMSGKRGLVMMLAGRLMFDRAIGKDFDKGLASLKAAAESR
ncbi:SRPBCC family protein [Nocardioides sp.]|uniref:SRPBCC family protein n=1 Tax=Nocardioides sp. TaxID=35761 RepID=UPI00286DCC57|nr:SRPBCC family protein [Nocardioides sp.]